MIYTRSALARLALLVLVTVVLQVAGVAPIRLLGGSPDIVPLAVAAVALYAGSICGAVTGFSMGLLVDLALGHYLGTTSLVLTTVGYAVGRFGELRDPAHGLIPIPVGAGATAGYVGGSTLVAFMLQIEAPVSVLVFREMLATVLLSALIAVPVFVAVRRLLGPALAVDPLAARARRRRVRPVAPIGVRGFDV